MANIKRDKNGLTEMQRRFVAAYAGPAAFLNGTEAAKLAGYSRRTAYSIGSELKSKPHVRRAIERRVDELYPNETFESDCWPVGTWHRAWRRASPERRIQMVGERYGRAKLPERSS